LADATSNAEILGDEPFQFYQNSKTFKWPLMQSEERIEQFFAAKARSDITR
jgi:hypothetical protein